MEAGILTWLIVTLTEPWGVIKNLGSEILEQLNNSWSIAAQLLTQAWNMFLDDIKIASKLLSDALQAWLKEYPVALNFFEMHFWEISVSTLAFTILGVLFLASVKAKKKLHASEINYSISFDDISLEAAQQLERALTAQSDLNNSLKTSTKAVASERVDRAEDADGEMANDFRFFKKKSKQKSLSERQKTMNEDVFLLAIEQEMLATRQLFVDGLISKDVYVAETKSLFCSAQKRMT